MQAGLFEEQQGPSGESLDEIKREILEMAEPLYPGRAFVFGMGNEHAARASSSANRRGRRTSRRVSRSRGRRAIC